MLIQINDLITLSQKEKDNPSIILTPITDVTYSSADDKVIRIWERSKDIPFDKLMPMQKKGVKSIEIKFSNLLYKSLVNHCPESYRNPYTNKNFIEVDKVINTFDRINKISKRQRSFSFMYELYDEIEEEFIIKFGEPVDFAKWNSIKRKIKKDSQLPILFNERGIILFVDLSQKSDEGFVERFKKNADLCTILTQRKHDYQNFTFSPDFNTLTDIWAVNEPGKLLESYTESNAKLIVVGDKINDSYKEALLQVKKYDRFARFIVSTNINTEDCLPLLKSVKEAYNKDNYEIA